MLLGELILLGLVLLVLYKPLMWLSERAVRRLLRAWSDVNTLFQPEDKLKK